MKCCLVIPARMAATRFPGKPLVDLLGKPMIQWVYEAAVKSGVGDQVVVATPDDEILEVCKGFGATAILTSESHPSGTDRIAEVSQQLVADYYINIQGDEPLVSQQTIQACAEPLATDPSVLMTSCWAPCASSEESNPAVVKVVTDLTGNALYFSRYPIPYPRSPRTETLKKHIGIYGYRREVLQKFSTWPMSPLEVSEGLEQLRFLENGVRIRMTKGEASGIAIDTPEQAEQVRFILADKLRNQV